MTVPEFPPALLLILGALLVPLFKGVARGVYLIALPVAALVLVALLPESGTTGLWPVSLLQGFDSLELLRVDRLSRPFGIIFTLNAAIVFLFAFHARKALGEPMAALVYIGSALGVVFAGDLITFYIFWEIMAVASAYIILSRNTETSRRAAWRYFLVHVFGGLLLLAGIAMTIVKTGSTAFNGFDWVQADTGTWLMMLGILVNAAAPPLSAWLSDAYPSASVTGGVILSAYTTKTAVYTLLRGFEGWEPLIWVGCAMTLYGLVFTILENDMRRMLAHSIVGQVGFMVCAAGIGGELAVNGAVAHAFCHIIYKSLLWMSAGAVLYRTGLSRCSDLGGLYRAMPWTMALGTIGALATSLPFTSGFASKSMIVYATEHAHLMWAWLALEIASAGVFLFPGLKFPYLVFFSRDSGLRPKEAPKTMLAAMGVLAFLCLWLGVQPQHLYALLPHPNDYQPFKAAKLIGQFQLLLFSALAFFLFLRHVKTTAAITLDTDWFYRKGAPFLARVLDRSLNGINRIAHRGIVQGLVRGLGAFFADAPARLAGLAAVPVLLCRGLRGDALAKAREELMQSSRASAFPVGLLGCLAVLALAALVMLFRR